MTKLTGVKSALSAWKTAADQGEPMGIYLDIPTGTIYADKLNMPEVMGLRIDNVCMMLYGNISMDTLRRYCDSKIYSTAIMLDVDNVNNPIYSNVFYIDSYVAFGGVNTEPDLVQIHINQINEDRANKFVQIADWIIDPDVERECAEGIVDTMTATARINARPDGGYTKQLIVTAITYKDV